MNGKSRRNFVLQASSLALASSIGPWLRTAKAAEFMYKIGTDQPLAHPMNQRLLQASDAIRKETDGRVDFKVFPDSQLGGDPSMLSQLRSGALEFLPVSGANVLSSLVPSAAITGIGFAFKDSQHVYQAMDGDLGALIRENIGKAGLIVQDKIWANGFRQITSGTHPVRNPDDLKNFKLRVPVSKMWTSLFQAFGSAPVGMSSNEIYSALQTKVVDGQENALLTISVSRFNEVQKYCSMTNHMWDGYWLLGNKTAWNRLPPTLREVVSRHFNGFADQQRKDVAELNESLMGVLAGKGLVFNTVDASAFQATLKKSDFYSQWKRSFGAEEWSLLEKVTGTLA